MVNLPVDDLIQPIKIGSGQYSLQSEKKMAPNFEDTCREFPILGDLILRANPEEREVLKRLFGFSSPLLGSGPTKTQLVINTLKFVVDELVKKPAREEKRKRQLGSNSGGDRVEEIEKKPEAENKNESKLSIQDEEHHKEDEQVSGEFKTVRRICRDFTHNRCRRGLDCKFSHPDVCVTFAKFGPYRDSNPKGCHSKNCDLLHARSKWCIKAVKFNKCLNPKCRFEHFRGTVKKETPDWKERRKENAPVRSQPNHLSKNMQRHNSYAQAAGAMVTPKNQDTKTDQPFLGMESLGIQQLMMEVMNRMDNIERRLQFTNIQSRSALLH